MGCPERCGKDDPYEEGEAAFYAYIDQPDPNSELMNCPYPDGTDEERAWNDGWDLAYDYWRYTD